MDKKQEVRVLNAIQAVARIRVEADSFRWPPSCVGILHQPKKPMQCSAVCAVKVE